MQICQVQVIVCIIKNQPIALAHTGVLHNDTEKIKHVFYGLPEYFGVRIHSIPGKIFTLLRNKKKPLKT